MSEISKELALLQQGIQFSLRFLDSTLVDCDDTKNTYSTIIRARHLLEDLTDIISYRRKINDRQEISKASYTNF